MDGNGVYLWCSFLLMLRALPHFTNLLVKLFWRVCNTMALLHGSSGRIPFNSLQGISIVLEPLRGCSVVHSTQPSSSHGCHYSHHTAISSLCLPQGIRIVNTGPHFTVVSYRASIPKGTRFGPYRGRVIQPSQVKEGEDNEYLWEVSIVKPLINKTGIDSVLMKYILQPIWTEILSVEIKQALWIIIHEFMWALTQMYAWYCIVAFWYQTQPK